MRFLSVVFSADAVQDFLERYMRTGDLGKWSGQNYSKVAWSYYIFQQWYDRYM